MVGDEIDAHVTQANKNGEKAEEGQPDEEDHRPRPDPVGGETERPPDDCHRRQGQHDQKAGVTDPLENATQAPGRSVEHEKSALQGALRLHVAESDH